MAPVKVAKTSEHVFDWLCADIIKKVLRFSPSNVGQKKTSDKYWDALAANTFLLAGHFVNFGQEWYHPILSVMVNIGVEPFCPKISGNPSDIGSIY